MDRMLEYPFEHLEAWIGGSTTWGANDAGSRLPRSFQGRALREIRPVALTRRLVVWCASIVLVRRGGASRYSPRRRGAMALAGARSPGRTVDWSPLAHTASEYRRKVMAWR